MPREFPRESEWRSLSRCIMVWLGLGGLEQSSAEGGMPGMCGCGRIWPGLHSSGTPAAEESFPRADSTHQINGEALGIALMGQEGRWRWSLHGSSWLAPGGGITTKTSHLPDLVLTYLLCGQLAGLLCMGQLLQQCHPGVQYQNDPNCWLWEAGTEHSIREDRPGEWCASSRSISGQGQYASSVALPGRTDRTSPECAYDCGAGRSCNECATVFPPVDREYMFPSVAQSRDLQKGAGGSHRQWKWESQRSDCMEQGPAVKRSTFAVHVLLVWYSNYLEQGSAVRLLSLGWVCLCAAIV